MLYFVEYICWDGNDGINEEEFIDGSSCDDEHGDEVIWGWWSLCTLISFADEDDGDEDDLLVFGVE